LDTRVVCTVSKSRKDLTQIKVFIAASPIFDLMRAWKIVAAVALVHVVLSYQLAPCAIAQSETLDSVPRAGEQVYGQHCAACHGPNGDGSGAASAWLFPRPRNFSAGLFKIKSTAGMALPTDEDLFNTVTRGMPGSSMPSFTYLSENERREAVQYVKYLTASTDASGKRINRFVQAAADHQLAEPIVVPPEPPVTVQSIAEGAHLFSKLNCVICHGETGAGDGPNASTLKDTQGLFLPPRDFNTGAFRGGHTGHDLFTRIATGLAGTPMVAFDNKVMTDQER
jgi:mono/diheme cytochrome c family protein